MAEIVKFVICENTEDDNQVIGKISEGKYKGKICFLPEYYNDEEIGTNGKGFVKSDEGNYFILMGITFEKN
jgi:hypothetical protein